jgi:hypothetical protein
LPELQQGILKRERTKGTQTTISLVLATCQDHSTATAGPLAAIGGLDLAATWISMFQICGNGHLFVFEPHSCRDKYDDS